MIRPLFCTIALLLTLSAQAWSNKEHIQLTRLAAERLIADPATPPAMKDWLKSACPQLLTPEQERDYFVSARVGIFPRNVDGIPYWATVPDMVALISGSGVDERKLEPFGVPERMLHFVDLEYFNSPEPRRRYRHDLSNKPKLEDISYGMKDSQWSKAGMLPFRIEQCYAQLVENLRKKRFTDKAGQFPRDEHAARWAGYLAHYLEDNTQPQHATEDYKARSYFADKRSAPNVHWDFEGRLMDDDQNDYAELREQFWTVFSKKLDEVTDKIDTIDLRTASLEISLISYDALPTIGLAAMKAYEQAEHPDAPTGGIKGFDAAKFFHHKGKYLGQEMTLMEIKAHQMAWAERRVEKLWLRAWNESQQPVEK